MCLQHSPREIACACMHVALEWASYQVEWANFKVRQIYPHVKLMITLKNTTTTATDIIIIILSYNTKPSIESCNLIDSV